MEITINIKTDNYMIKTAKLNTGKSSMVSLEKPLIGREILCIPLVSPDMIIVNETDDGEYLINCCGFEMIKKTVRPNNRKGKANTGYVLIPEEYLTDSVLVIPL